MLFDLLRAVLPGFFRQDLCGSTGARVGAARATPTPGFGVAYHLINDQSYDCREHNTDNNRWDHLSLLTLLSPASIYHLPAVTA